MLRHQNKTTLFSTPVSKHAVYTSVWCIFYNRIWNSSGQSLNFPFKLYYAPCNRSSMPLADRSRTWCGILLWWSYQFCHVVQNEEWLLTFFVNPSTQANHVCSSPCALVSSHVQMTCQDCIDLAMLIFCICKLLLNCSASSKAWSLYAQC